MNSEESEIEEKPRSKAGAVILSFAGIATVAALVAMPLVAQMPGSGLADLSQWERFLGRFHFLVLHLPIGMLCLVLLLEFGKLFRKDKGSSTLIPAFFTAVSAVVAAVFGFLLYQTDPGQYDEELISSHLWWGIGFAAMTVAAFVIKRWVDLANGSGNWVYVLTLLISGATMTVASHDGGSMVHGKSYLTAEAPNEVRELYNQIVPENQRLPMLEAEEDGDGGAPVIPVEDQIVYTHLVQPIFDQKCVSCHGPDKQKGRLRMDTYENLVLGGKEGEAITPGDAEDSNILFRIHLPLDDEEHMPPENKEQMEDHEIEIVTWWIDTGALPDQKVAEAEMPEEIKAAVSKLVPPEVLQAQAEAAAAAAAAEEKARAELATVVEGLREEFPGALNFESQESSGLTFTAVSMRDRFNDEMLAKLEPVAESLVSLDLSGTHVTDTGLAAVSGATGLRMLRLSETGVTDAGIEQIKGMASLESLNLYGTAVTTDGVAVLSELPTLKRLYLWQTEVDAAGKAKLEELMPETEIILGIEAE
ncbi:c-type cytochrome domain-containing protein [Haloferula sp. A504]|uniref:c-type cytochrome domain-containing protein n=1 Tax=Haloferula sp. A504 TaxID=3373601 RepID=UPI0031C1828D|nr:hypothetical protein [Verrucomicrobiaceae bacterium E54]